MKTEDTENKVLSAKELEEVSAGACKQVICPNCKLMQTINTTSLDKFAHRCKKCGYPFLQ